MKKRWMALAKHGLSKYLSTWALAATLVTPLSSWSLDAALSNVGSNAQIIQVGGPVYRGGAPAWHGGGGGFNGGWHGGNVGGWGGGWHGGGWHGGWGFGYPYGYGYGVPYSGFYAPPIYVPPPVVIAPPVFLSPLGTYCTTQPFGVYSIYEQWQVGPGVGYGYCSTSYETPENSSLKGLVKNAVFKTETNQDVVCPPANANGLPYVGGKLFGKQLYCEYGTSATDPNNQGNVIDL